MLRDALRAPPSGQCDSATPPIAEVSPSASIGATVVVGRRRWDAPLQQVADAHVKADWSGVTAEREVWEAPEPEFVRRVLRTQVSVPPLPRRGQYVGECPPAEDVPAQQPEF